MLYVGLNKFVDVSASAVNTDCEPRGLNTAGASKELNFVGSIFTIFGDGPVALIGTAAAATGVGTVSAYTSHVPSNFYGVNATGKVIGDSYYLPFSGGSYVPEFVLDSSASNLSLAQPQCSGLAVNCGTDDYYDVCRFGGCYINDNAVVLAYDSTSAKLVTYNISTPKTVKEIPTVGGALIMNFPMINNLDDIAYTSTDSSAVHATTYFYSTSLGKTTTLPTFSKNTCTQYVAISMNNLGEILGYTANCQAAADQVYWTWTVGGGLQNLTAQLPSTSYALIAPLAVNDMGNILLGLEATTGTIHWGLLNLITSSVSRSS